MVSEHILRSFAGSNVLVTGGTGMIGRPLVDILVESGANVKVVSLSTDTPNDNVEYITADLCDFTSCINIIKGSDFVFHMAGVKASVRTTNSIPSTFFVKMIMMNTNVLECCRLNGVRKVVYTSSIGAYAQDEVLKEGQNPNRLPMDLYPGLAKRMGEYQIQSYRIQYNLEGFSSVRLSHIYGPDDYFGTEGLVISSLMYRIRSGSDPLVVWGDGSAIRDFAYSVDIAKGIILALYYGTKNEYVNLGSGVGYSIKELVETLAKFIDFNYEFDCSKISGSPKRVMDISLAKETMGYKPTTSLLDGLQNTWEWFVEQK